MRVFAALVLGFVLPVSALADYAPPPHSLFDGDAVHEIHLTFSEPAWYDTLVANFEGVEDPGYLEAQFDWGDCHFDTIGVRFKGNSSYLGYPTDKKSFKLDLNRFVSGQDLEGLQDLNLNNCFKDPSYVREKAFWELAEAAGLPYIRVNYAALHINGEYWGLYTITERVDDEFVEFRFGSGEGGNLFKGDPHGTLEYLGASEADYYGSYELKTNEVENDWSRLVRFIDALNHTSYSALPDSLSGLLDVNSALAMLALNSLTVNLDSYTGTGHNLYFYQRELDSRFVCIPWDANEAWGCFNFGIPMPILMELPPNWLSWPQETRPLAFHLWTPTNWEAQFHGHILTLMSGAADPDVLLDRMTELRWLVDTYAATETRCMYSYSDFLNAMFSNIGGVPALDPFIRTRHTYLNGILGSYTAPAGLVLNELMASNDATITDEFGEYDDWLEIANVGAGPISLDGLSLTDDSAYPFLFSLPDTTLQSGEYLLVWCDDDTVQGDLHAGFKLSSSGETVWLLDQGIVIEQVTYPAIAADISYGRWEDGTGSWQILGAATPGAVNENPEEPEEVVLYLNEFMAKNDTGLQDETGAYEDWLEIWNPGPEVVEMGGLFLSDDLSLTTKWSFPDTTLVPGGFMLVWCDDDTGDGPLHTNFKLGASGEEIGIFGRVAAGNETIDSYVFGAQTADVSEGRETDGAAAWVFFTTPTPGASNGGASSLNGHTPSRLTLAPARPNPFNPATDLHFVSPAPGNVHLTVIDAHGRLVKELVNETLPAGIHVATWRGLDTCGRTVSSGVYFARLVFADEQRVIRMTLVR